MLTGQAKVDYQREYMRRRRAGLGKPPKGERPPTKSELFEIRHLATNQHGHRHYQTIRNRLLNGLDKDAPDFIVQAVQRLGEHKRKLRAKREAKALEALNRSALAGGEDKGLASGRSGFSLACFAIGSWRGRGSM